MSNGDLINWKHVHIICIFLVQYRMRVGNHPAEWLNESWSLMFVPIWQACSNYFLLVESSFLRNDRRCFKLKNNFLLFPSSRGGFYVRQTQQSIFLSNNGYFKCVCLRWFNKKCFTTKIVWKILIQTTVLKFIF